MERAIAEVFNKGAVKKFAAGELVTSGEDAKGVFLIRAGFIKVYSISDEGNEYLHIIYKPGETFPLIWALLGLRRRVFYEALTDCTLNVLAKAEFIEETSRNAEFSFGVLKSLAEQFYVYADRIDNLQYKTAYEKVVYRLLFLAGRFGSNNGEGILIELPVTHELISESINLARESVSRQIEKLEKQNLISYEKGYIILKDAKALSREFSEPVSLNLWGLTDSSD